MQYYQGGSMELTGSNDIRTALRLVGELLAADGLSLRIVVIGGAAMNLHGYAERTTTDVDIIAVDDRAANANATMITAPPQPLPDTIVQAIRIVARQRGLPDEWLNTGPAGQWLIGLPVGFADRVVWPSTLDFGGLIVGLAGRSDLIAFKLFAAADHRDAHSVHYQDLRALRPTLAELDAAVDWLVGQDQGPEWATTLERLMQYARRDAANDWR
ncbi:MAG: DUF6036 family nucleotidyltransferase [Gammaproteobacteria bacterium]